MPEATKMAVGLFNKWPGRSVPLNASKVLSAESISRLCTVKEVGTYKARKAFQNLHLHGVKLPVEMATQEVGIACREKEVRLGKRTLASAPACEAGSKDRPC